MAPEPVSGLERMIERAVERALIRVLDSGTVNRVWDHVLASDEVQRLVERIAEAPEVRSAITSQGAGLLEDVGREVRRVTMRLDRVFERIVRRLLFRRRRAEPTDRAGIVSRGLALALDAAIINASFFVLSWLAAVLVSLVLPDSTLAQGAAIAVGTGVWLSLFGAYLFVFWTLAGQTPGMRFLGLRLTTPNAGGLTPGQSFRRLIGLVLSIIPFGLGLLPIMTDERRRGLLDRIGRTEVIYEPLAPRAAPWSTEGQRQVAGRATTSA